MFLKKTLLILLSIFVGLITSEILLRIKHNVNLDYDVEMWRYAKLLKTKDENPKINHTHKLNSVAILQGVEVKINKFGQRDINYNNNDLKNFDRSFLFIGSSITLGWGVKNNQTYVQLLNTKAKIDKKNFIYINGGVGNYNTERYVNNYFENWAKLNFTDIVINFFVNDTEIIDQKDTNFFIKNTHLGIAFWKLVNQIKTTSNQESLTEYYKSKYDESYKGFKISKKEILKLNEYCKKNNINLHLILIPDIHKTNPYPLKFIGEKISKFSTENNIKYLDLYPSISLIENYKLWNKYNDPHPNEYGHKLYADFIYTNLIK